MELAPILSYIQYIMNSTTNFYHYQGGMYTAQVHCTPKDKSPKSLLKL